MKRREAMEAVCRAATRLDLLQRENSLYSKAALADAWIDLRKGLDALAALDTGLVQEGEARRKCSVCAGTGIDDTPTFDRDLCTACGGTGEEARDVW